MASESASAMPAAYHATLLIQFARSPEVGGVKTRMTPFLSDVDACELHCELVLWTCGRLLESAAGEVELSVAGPSSHTLFADCLALGAARITRQWGEDLGQRMYHGLSNGLQQYDKVLLVGSDCPGIDTAYIDAARSSLDDVDVVIGPATDGGYVLIGARHVTPALFEGVAWGTELVLQQTLALLQESGLSWVCLPALSDIDRPEDLPVWDALKKGGS